MFEGPDKVQPSRPRPTRLPKMGVTSVTRTSTPKSEFPKSELASPKSPKYRIPEAASPKTPNFRKSGNFDFENGNDEPIYCEIVTPGKSPKRITNNFEPISQKSSNLVRTNYIRQSTGISNNSEFCSKSPNPIGMNYKRQNSNNSDFILKSPGSVRNGFVRQQISNNNNSSNFVRNAKPDSSRLSSIGVSSIRNNYMLGKQESQNVSNFVRNSNNSDLINSNNNPRQPYNWSQRYRSTNVDEPDASPNKNRSRNPSISSELGSNENRVVLRIPESPVRSIFGESENDPSPIFRAPVAPKMSQSVYGLGRRAHTQLEISTSRLRDSRLQDPRWRQIGSEESSAQVRCSEVKKYTI